MAKQLIFNQLARQSLENGINIVANAVKVTLGPRGQNVIYFDDRTGKSIVTKDGVTVAKQIELPDTYENLGAQLCIQSATSTNIEAGDGTTTSTVLTQALVNQGMKFLGSGGNAVGLKRGLEKALAKAEELLSDYVQEINGKEQVEFVARISGNDNEVGSFVAQAIEMVGIDGMITVEQSKARDTTLEMVHGMNFARGMFSSVFVNNPQRPECVYEQCKVLLFDGKFDDFMTFAQFIDNDKTLWKVPILFIAEDYSAEVMMGLCKSKIAGKKWVAVKTPGFGEQKSEIIKDIAAFTHAVPVSVANPMDKLNRDWLGQCAKIISRKDTTTLFEGHGKAEDIEARASYLKVQMETSESKYIYDQLQDRLAKLLGSVVVIKVGASTEAELEEKLDRYEDALNATRAAIEQGIVPGGGCSLLRISKRLYDVFENQNWSLDERRGVEILINALQEPIRQIAYNAGYSPDIVTYRVCEYDNKNVGFDANTGEYVDMFESGIIDPVKVTRSALLNAGSIACLILTTDTLIANIPLKDPILVSETMV